MAILLVTSTEKLQINVSETGDTIGKVIDQTIAAYGPQQNVSKICFEFESEMELTLARDRLTRVSKTR